ncbi:hypothetical protein AB0P05_33500 [Streptomyces flaveolus]|uniref:hypothetical protein n=1 Tax=Streptomyces flaveolus TaxID=67297 RepID=UPI003425CF12
MYETIGRDVARVYAAFKPDGALYEVHTDGPLEDDPDCTVPGVSFACPPPSSAWSTRSCCSATGRSTHGYAYSTGPPRVPEHWPPGARPDERKRARLREAGTARMD